MTLQIAAVLPDDGGGGDLGNKDGCGSAMYFCADAGILPIPFVHFIASNPTSDVAAEYRRFVGLVLLPHMKRMAAILKAHSNVLILPDKEWLKQTFPEE
eukprot:SAG31_NODE_22896_length_515_cov_34.711538_1_plen_98_part_10